MESNIIIYQDNIDTDVIIPARYLNNSDPEHLSAHCMEDIDPDFPKKVKPGYIIVAGKNFGCGSSREHAPLAIKSSGISLIIAKSFARIFYRNSINIGLPIVESEEIVENIEEGDQIQYNLNQGTITIVNKNKTFHIPPYPKEIQDIIKAGGLLKSIGGK